MAKPIYALPQTTVEVDDISYLITAMPATVSLEVQKEIMDNMGEPSISTVKRVICGSATLDGKDITEKSFDIIFARRTGHLYKLASEIITWNMPDLFQNEGTDEA